MKRLTSILLILILIPVLAFCEYSEDEIYEAYIMCQPKSYVNLRIRPSSRAMVEGWFLCGDTVKLDGKSKGSWLHCVDLSMEISEGWVNSGYVVYDKPIEVNVECAVIGKGRVAARKAINGSRRCWLKPGTIVKVLWKSDEWCVTNYGFIKTEFLEVN